MGVLLSQIPKNMEAALNLGNENLEACSRKSVHCCEWTFKSNPGEDPEDRGEL